MPGRSESEMEDVARDGRSETEAERADRNWNEVLQELRVLQTGTQILTGFLLALAFQQRFEDLDPQQRDFYLVLVVLSGLCTIVALAPVALHRLLFRRQVKAEVVAFGHVALIGALATVSVLLVAVVAFVFDVVLAAEAALTVSAVLAVVILVLWVIIPLMVRARARTRGGPR